MPYAEDRAKYVVPERLLTTIQNQEKLLHGVASEPAPCPICQQPVNTYEATNDQYTATGGNWEGNYRCPHCGVRLEDVVPFFPSGPARQWVVHPDEVERVRGAIAA
jgi:C4-type Zn-finger protein